MNIRIALAGNPNSGKTTLFNALTGSNQFVGNWPGVTVEKKEGKLKKHDGVTVTDLPGIYSLSPYTLEEVVARNYLIGERPDAILNIIDGTNLERNLYLTTQLVELGIPVVVAINMMDVVKKNGDKLNTADLAKQLGCKVVEISALKGTGVMEAAEAAIEAAQGGKTVPQHTFSGPVEHALAHIEEAAVHGMPEEQQRWYAIKVFERDDKVLEQLNIAPETMKHIESDIAAAEKELDDDAESIITNERYVYIAQVIKSCYRKHVYRDYTDYVEPASIDESYLDLSGTLDYYGMTARELADTIRARVKREIGITISVGVANNKIFAKMGSDYKKPDATTVILGEDYKTILWPLPVSDLMFAGKASVQLLNQKGIHTVGDLAVQPKAHVVSMLGKGGESLWIFANGLDTEPVRRWGDVPEVKSVSHGMTFRRDLVTREEIETGVAVQADRIAMSLRRQELKGSVITVQIKTPQLVTISRQVSLNHYTWLEHEIREVAMKLIEEHWHIGDPIRAITVGVSKRA